MPIPLSFWIAFNVFVLVMLALDLGVLHRGRQEALSFSEAITWSAVWVLLAAGFAVGVRFWLGHQLALEFTTGYLIELSLSIDNLFVFLLIFKYFHVPPQHQHKVLFWGILGALVMRAIFILAGVRLIQRFHWLVYVFGAFLVYKGIEFLRHKGAEIHPEKNPILRVLRRVIPITDQFEGDKFFVRRGGLFATPLLVALIMVEISDIVFAVDSVPAILAISLNAFIVYTSNVFAIMGLRSMYFALAGMMEVFHYLHNGLALVLIFVGGKMLLSHYYTIPTPVALGVVATVLLVSIGASLASPAKKKLKR